MNTLFKNISDIIKSQFPGEDFIPLHAPVFKGKEKEFVMDAIGSTFVSSVGRYVRLFEDKICEITGAEHAIAIVNGTNALHIALLLAGLNADDEVLSQSLTFVATANAISYTGAKPVFIDVDKDTLGLSPVALDSFLKENAEVRKNGFTYNKNTGRCIKACIPMHTFGFPCRIDEIAKICREWNISLIEDAAESLGSNYKDKHTGTFGHIGVFSFNGNKIITAGGGGAIITNDATLAEKAKHLTTQAKQSHRWKFIHDEIGYNYRMPNLNAALVCAQLDQLDLFVENKRNLSLQYSKLFNAIEVPFVMEIDNARANYWLNAILLKDEHQRDAFLEYANGHGIMSRPCWELMHRLPMYRNSFQEDLHNSEWIAERLVNIPSSVRL